MSVVDATDLDGILSLMRTHIEIRNRSWMTRVHRDCFIGSDAVDFLVTQGFCDTRKEALDIAYKMVSKAMIVPVTGKRRKFQDSYFYYRFKEDNLESSELAPTNAGNGSGLYLGQGGCKFNFCPHTAHNSYVLDIALAEEIERAIAGASVEARARAIGKLRARVREQAEPDAPDWTLIQSTEVNETLVSVFQRKRPRGDFKNVKMTGMVAESPKAFIRGIMSSDRRKYWERMFEDSVVVEVIDVGESSSPIFADDDNNVAFSSSPPVNMSIPSPSNFNQTPVNAADDLISFLQTVDQAGIPDGMSVAFLNDPERQHALGHLRKQMMLSNPQDCMLCKAPFESAADIRFCPCCAMVSCGSCVSKRVFEVVSRQIVSVCIHCFRESSRIRQPPQAVQDSTGLNAYVRGKWWRPEELGIIDYSQTSNATTSYFDDVTLQEGLNKSVKPLVPGLSGLDLALEEEIASESTSPVMETNSAAHGAANGVDIVANNSLEKSPSASPSSLLTQCLTGSNILRNLSNTSKPASGSLSINVPEEEEDDDEADDDEGNLAGDGIGRGVNEADYVNASIQAAQNTAAAAGNNASTNSQTFLSKKMSNMKLPFGSRSNGAPLSPKSPTAGIAGTSASVPIPLIGIALAPEKFAKCKSCGMQISRDIEAIEEHMAECVGQHARTASMASGYNRQGSLAFDGSTLGTLSNSKQLAGIQRRPDLEKAGTRILYRTARPSSKVYAPREVCVLQDSFVHSDGSCYVYEISVRHCDVRGMPGYVTADVLLLMHVARPVKGSRNMCNITIISQVDTRVQGPQWLLSFITEEGANDIGVLGREDLVRELKASGNLQNILRREQEQEDGEVSLEDFDLLAVLGRGGFGKVMQVRHRPTNVVYAMKILKKTELRRRRQVERTQTERTILAAVRHPFIVCLHYAFQSPQKLYMVMDFVQGGDFFTLMRKFKRLPESWVVVYVSQMAMALQHLHDMDVVYRDLKPENILLDGAGHLKLTDFGLSRFFETRPPAAEDMIGEDDVVTRSFCGTEQYMSPEMLLQQGHNYRMDWWCIGLLMHEMISARHPFQGPSHYDTLRNMVTKPPNVDHRLSASAASIVRAFLEKKPKTRLCCKDGISELKVLPFFANIDWDALYELRVEMPYKPELKDNTDISSFETTFTREAPVDSLSEQTGGSKSKKSSNKMGIMGLFGMGGSGNANRASDDADVFKGFTFTKEEEVSTSAAVSSSPPAGNS